MLEISDIETRSVILSRQQTTNALIRLRGCAGWSAPLLFAYDMNRFSHDVAHLLYSNTRNLQFFSWICFMMPSISRSWHLWALLNVTNVFFVILTGKYYVKIGHSDTIMKGFLRHEDISRWHCSGGDPWLVNNLTKLVRSMFTGKHLYSGLLKRLLFGRHRNTVVDWLLYCFTALQHY